LCHWITTIHLFGSTIGYNKSLQCRIFYL
jgi:hypothetical protein